MLYFSLSVPNRRQSYKMQVKDKKYVLLGLINDIMYSIGITYKELLIIMCVFLSEVHQWTT